MPLGMEVDLAAGHIVLDGDPVQKGQSPQFSAQVCCAHVCCGWMDQDATW